jgi:hypothetical protein
MDDDELRGGSRRDFIEHATASHSRHLRSEVDPRLIGATAPSRSRAPRSATRSRRRPVFIAPPSPEDPRAARGTGSTARGDLERPAVAEGSWGPGEFGHVIVNDDVELASRELIDFVRGRLEGDS